MNKMRAFLSSHKRLFAVCVFFCCIVLSAVMLLPPMGHVGAADGEPASTGAYKAEAKPLHTYTSLSVEIPKGLTVYAGKTTVEMFKNNLTVMGTYRPSAGSDPVTVKLLPDEYILVDETGENINKDKTDVLMADTTSGGIPTSVDCGTVSEKIGAVGLADDYPVLSTVTATVKDGVEIENINTAETIKDLLVVSGTLTSDSTEVYIGNKELYDISFAGSKLAVGDKTEITITYKGQTPYREGKANVKVVTAQLQSIAVKREPRAYLRRRRL